MVIGFILCLCFVLMGMDAAEAIFGAKTKGELEVGRGMLLLYLTIVQVIPIRKLVSISLRDNSNKARRYLMKYP